MDGLPLLPLVDAIDTTLGPPGPGYSSDDHCLGVVALDQAVLGFGVHNPTLASSEIAMCLVGYYRVSCPRALRSAMDARDPTGATCYPGHPCAAAGVGLAPRLSTPWQRRASPGVLLASDPSPPLYGHAGSTGHGCGTGARCLHPAL